MYRKAGTVTRRFPTLRGREEVDVAIIGGGLSGLTAAVWLSRSGLRVAIAEAGELGRGATAHCMGCVSIGGVSCVDLTKRLGHAGAEAFFETTTAAFQILREWLEPLGKWKQHKLYMMLQDEESMEREWEAARKLGLKGERLAARDVPAICLQDAAQISMADYLPLLVGIAQEQGARIYEHSRVVAMETNEIMTEHGSIRAPYLLVMTGYPILNIPGWYFLWLTQRAYAWKMVRGEIPQEMLIESIGAAWVVPAQGGGRLLCRCGTVGSRRYAQQAEKAARQITRSAGVKAVGEWHYGIEVHTPDGIPLIGPYAPKTPDLFAASAYGGRGILGSVMAAQAVSSRILGLPSERFSIYDGRRFYVQWKPPLSAAVRHVGSALFHPRAPRCPHMGCRLVLNPHTRLWECPCHGSCFDDIGHVLQAPAVHEAVLRNRK